MTEKELQKEVPRILKEALPFAQIRVKRQGGGTGGRAVPLTPDMLVEFKTGGKTRKLLLKVKSLGYPSHLLQAIPMLKRAAEKVGGYPVIITDQVSERGAALAKESGVGYLDLAGNCYLNMGEIYIEKTAKEKLNRPSGELRRLFSRKATRVIRTLLELHDKSWEVIKLARESLVSVGHAYKVSEKLLQQGFLVEEQKKIRLKDAGKLFDAWADQYRIDNSKVHSFYTDLKDPKKLMSHISQVAKEKKFACAFTLHAGESIVAPFTRFTEVHFYLGEAISDDVLKDFGLEKIEFGGTVHIIEPYDEGVFHHQQVIDEIPIVSNTQLYLDLFQYPARGKEAAEFLRREKMKI